MRLRDLDLLAAAAAQSTSLEQFTAELALDPPQSSADLARQPTLDEDYLVLSTIHSAKGLEWDDRPPDPRLRRQPPLRHGAHQPDGLEEERRLLYVALTRSRRSLNVYVPLRYFHQPVRGERRERARQNLPLPHRGGAVAL